MVAGQTYIGVLIALSVWALFIHFVIKDLKREIEKLKLIEAGKELNPFMFSGEKAKKELEEFVKRYPEVRKDVEEILASG